MVDTIEEVVMGALRISPLLLIIVPLVIWLFGSHRVRIITGLSLIVIGGWFWIGIGAKADWFGRCIGSAGIMVMLLEFAAVDREATADRKAETTDA
jgi:Na+/citrate or Na+/malate symporter